MTLASCFEFFISLGQVQQDLSVRRVCQVVDLSGDLSAVHPSAALTCAVGDLSAVHLSAALTYAMLSETCLQCTFQQH